MRHDKHIIGSHARKYNTCCGHQELPPTEYWNANIISYAWIGRSGPVNLMNPY